MAKLTEIFLAITLLSLFFTAHQAQGRNREEEEAFDAAEYVPVQPLKTAQQVVLPDEEDIGKVCKECTCCKNGNEKGCALMKCCTQRACNIPGTPPGTCGDVKFLYCGCDNCS